MSIRSKLFATVAFPLLSLSVAMPPALAVDLRKPFEVAQENGAAMPDDGSGAMSAEEKRRIRAERRKQQQQDQQQPDQAQAPADNGDGSGGTSAEEKRRIRAERRKQQQDQQQPDQAQAPADNGDAAGGMSAEEKRRIRAERRKQQQDQQQPDKAQAPADNGDAAQETSAEEKRRIRAERRKQQQDQQQPDQAQQPSDNGDAAQETSAEEKRRIRAERRKQQQDQQQPDQAQQPADNGDATQETSAEEKRRIRAERRKQQQDQQQPDQAQQPADNGDAADGASAEEKRRIRAERRKQQLQDQQQQDDQQPNQADRAKANGEYSPLPTSEDAPRRKPAREVVDKRTEKEKQQLARDPSRSDETVVLPVDNGAAVLDSDKDADNRGGEDARDKRRQQRERARAQEQDAFVPKSDADAQSRGGSDRRRPSRADIEAANREEGRRIDRAPTFDLNDAYDNYGGDRRRPRIQEEGDNRTVIDFGDQIIVRSDDRPRLRRNAEQSYYEELPRGRSREIIERPGGVKVVTVYNQYGDILQRSRIDANGNEHLMIYADEADDGPRGPAIDIGDELPPMRLTVPLNDYIVDTSSQPDRDYYDFLAEPPVEQVERTYSIDEVRNSARIRDKVRRIDLDTITFATGSSEVPMSQAKTLRKVADAMLEVIDKDPGETFLIEGHTDAVGSDQSNLVLSDERAEAVASALSEVYDIPPENLVTQGYGERFLKVRTEGAEQQNRRVTIRRVTALVRPVAQN